jgi:hypothetical protein
VCVSGGRGWEGRRQQGGKEGGVGCGGQKRGEGVAREGSHSCQHHLRPLLASREREREREGGRERETDRQTDTHTHALSLSHTQPAAMNSRALVQGRGIRVYSLGLVRFG